MAQRSAAPLVSSVPLSLTTVSGSALHAAEPLQFAHHPYSAQRGVDHRRQAFAAVVIDDAQDAEAPAVAQRVRDEVERPPLVDPARQRVLAIAFLRAYLPRSANRDGVASAVQDIAPESSSFRKTDWEPISRTSEHRRIYCNRSGLKMFSETVPVLIL